MDPFFKYVRQRIEPHISKRSRAWKKLLIAALFGAGLSAWVCIQNPLHSTLATCGVVFIGGVGGILAGVFLMLFDSCASTDDEGEEEEKKQSPGILREIITAIGLVVGAVIAIVLICLLIVTVMGHMHVR